jgi:hypothetical protein
MFASVIYALFLGLFHVHSSNVSSVQGYNRSNELAQYEYYLHYVINDTIPIGSRLESELFSKCSNHSVGTHSRDIVHFFAVSNAAKKALVAMFPPLWKWVNHTSTSYNAETNLASVEVMVERDCDYWAELDALTIHHKDEEDATVLDVVFHVHQFRCLSSTAIQGGAAIDALSVAGIYTTTSDNWNCSNSDTVFRLSQLTTIRCSVDDLFDNNYRVHCSVSVHGKLSTVRPIICLNTSLSLQFEHYDAYSELKITNQSLSYSIPSRNGSQISDNFMKILHSIGYDVVQYLVDDANNHIICFGPAISKRTGNLNGFMKPEFHRSEGIGFSYPLLSGKSFWTMTFPTESLGCVVPVCRREPELQRFQLDRQAIANRIQPSYRHVTSQVATQQLHFALKHIHTVIFVGESHCRFYWDFTMKGYFNAYTETAEVPKSLNQLYENPSRPSFIQTEGARIFDVFNNEIADRHFTSYAIKEMPFKWQIFADNAAQELVSSSSYPMSPTEVKYGKTIIVQTGFWDLLHWPLRAYMESRPHGMYALIDALSSIFAGRKEIMMLSHNSSKRSALGVLNVIILDTMVLERSTNESVGWHNNFAISAANQKLTREILRFVSINNGVRRNTKDQYSRLLDRYVFADAAMIITFVNFAPFFHGKHWGLGSVCGKHLLCRHDHGEMIGITHGITARNMILHMVSDVSQLLFIMDLGAQWRVINLNATTHKSRLIQYLNSVKQNWSEWEMEELDIVYAPSDALGGDDMKKQPLDSAFVEDRRCYFLISKGLRRRIPDKDTFALLIQAKRKLHCFCGDATAFIRATDSCVRETKKPGQTIRALPSDVLAAITEDANPLPPLRVSSSSGPRPLLYHCKVHNDVFFIDSDFKARSCRHCPNRREFDHELCPVEDMLHPLIQNGPHADDCFHC